MGTLKMDVEDIRKLLKATYKPMPMPLELRKKLLNRLLCQIKARKVNKVGVLK